MRMLCWIRRYRLNRKDSDVPTIITVCLGLFLLSITQSHAGERGEHLKTESREPVLIEIQAVTASDPDNTEENISPSLDPYKAILQNIKFGTFKDAGHQVVKLSGTKKNSARLGDYTIELSAIQAGAEMVELKVTCKQNEKPTGAPLSCKLSKGKPKLVLEYAHTSTLFFLTMKDKE